jgi:type II secretory pathway component PulF
MPLFTYKAKDQKGNIVEDVIQAADKKEAASYLEADQL